MMSVFLSLTLATHPIHWDLEENGVLTMRLRHVLKALILSLIGMPSIVLGGRETEHRHHSHR